MIAGILTNTPVWVWILLMTFIGLGLLQTRPRELSLARVTLLPLVFVGLSLYGVLGTFGPALFALGAWTVGFGAVAILARQALAVQGASWSTQHRRLRVPGSWLPFVLIIGLFAIKYGVAVGRSIHPHLAANDGFMAACSLVYGGFAGSFWVRAQSLRALARSAARQPEITDS